MDLREIVEKYRRYLYGLSTYYTDPLPLVRGEGKWLWDVEGRKYLDFFGGILTVSVGHCEPRVVAAIEKQARTLEPLLATPVTTAELLAAKVLGSFLPALLLTLLIFGLLLSGTVTFAQPGVYLALLTPQSLLVVFVAGPLAALAALQMAVCVSSRANDARGAQQIGAIIILVYSAFVATHVVAKREES